MKIHYYKDTDSLYIELRDKPSSDSREVVDGVQIDLDENQNIVGIDIDHASQKLDLTSLETIELPIKKKSA